MDPRNFDALTRSLASPRTRRGFIGGLAALGAGLLGARAAGAEDTQRDCGNVVCGSNPGVCNPGCVCCTYANGNSRCMPPGKCTGAIATTTTTTTTTTTVPPLTSLGGACTAPDQCASGACCGDRCVDILDDDAHCGACGKVCPNLCEPGACTTGPCCATSCWAGACHQYQIGPGATCNPDVTCFGIGDTCGAGGYCCTSSGTWCFFDDTCCSGVCNRDSSSCA